MYTNALNFYFLLVWLACVARDPVALFSHAQEAVREREKRGDDVGRMRGPSGGLIAASSCMRGLQEGVHD